MIVESVEVENFGSIGKAKMRFDIPGLHAVIGRNRDQDRSNGAGKTSLFEAFYWGLFGQITKAGVRAKGDVLNNKTDGDCRVAMVLKDDDQRYQIERVKERKRGGRHYLNLMLQGETKEFDLRQKSVKGSTDAIEQILGMNADTFLRSHYLCQRSPVGFGAMTDGQLKDFFLSHLLCLDWIGNAYSLARSDALETANILNVKRQQKGQIEAQIPIVQAKVDSLSLRETEWVEMQQREIVNLDREIDALNQQITQAAQSQADAEQRLKEIQSKIDGFSLDMELQSRHSYLLGEKGQIIAKYNNLKVQGKKLIDEIQRYVQAQSATSERIGTTCKECGTEITTEHIPHLTRGYAAKIGELKEQEADNREGYQATVEKYKAVEQEIASLVVQIEAEKGKREELSRLQTELRATQRFDQTPQLKAQLEKVIQRKAAKAGETNPYSHMIQGEKIHIEELKNNLASLDVEIEMLQTKAGDIEFWVKGFSPQGIQSYLLDSITPVLNEKLKDVLLKISGGEMQASFSTVTKLKSGEYREKFALEVKNLMGGDSYHFLSGGESQRIDLATSIVMADLVRSRTSKPLQLLIFDEPFRSLDQDGIDCVLDYISTAYRGVSVFLVTHTDLDRTKLTSEITVEKRNGISRIIN